MEQKIKCVNENEVRYFVGTQKTRWNDSKKNMWKRKIQIKNVQTDLLGTLLNLLRLKIEKKRNETEFKLLYLLSLTTWRESLPPQFIGLVVLTKKKRKKKRKKKKYRLPNTLETTRIKLINDCISSDDLLFVLSKNVVSF